jgi:hypothetical protein
MKRAALMILFILMPTVTVSATTGNEWRAMSPALRDGYLLGVLDAWVLLEAVTRDSVQPVGRASMFTRVVGCLGKDMTYGQTIAIIGKYMQDNPSEWHHPMSLLAWIATDRACASAEKKAK